MDLLSEHDQEYLRNNVYCYHPESHAFFESGEFLLDVNTIRSSHMTHNVWLKETKGNDDILWSEVHCYESNISPLVDETAQNEKDIQKDTKLLKLFKDIIDLSLTPAGKKRTYSTSSKFILTDSLNPG